MIHPERLSEITERQDANPEEQREMALALLRFFCASEVNMSMTERIRKMKQKDKESADKAASELLNDWYDRYG